MTEDDKHENRKSSTLPTNATRVERFLALEQHPWARLVMKVLLVVGALAGGAEALYNRYDRFFLEPARLEQTRRDAAEREGTAKPPRVQVEFSGGGDDMCVLRNIDVRPVNEAIIWFMQAQVDLTDGSAEFWTSSSRDAPRARLHEVLPGESVTAKFGGDGLLRNPKTLPPGPHSLGCVPNHDCLWAIECRTEYLRNADRKPFYADRLSLIVNIDGKWAFRSLENFFSTSVPWDQGDLDKWRIERNWNDNRIRKAFEIYALERARRVQMEQLGAMVQSMLPSVLQPRER